MSFITEGITDVEMRAKTADYVTNKLRVGTSRVGSKQLGQFIPGDNQPLPTHQEAFDHGKRLETRRKIGYDPK